MRGTARIGLLGLAIGALLLAGCAFLGGLFGGQSSPQAEYEAKHPGEPIPSAVARDELDWEAGAAIRRGGSSIPGGIGEGIAALLAVGGVVWRFVEARKRKAAEGQRDATIAGVENYRVAVPTAKGPLAEAIKAEAVKAGVEEGLNAAVQNVTA